ncbi:MAG: hypothetical protein ACE5HM_05580 [Acidiferrobacterales bacterium]
MNIVVRILLCASVFVLGACTSGNEAPVEHVWQDQIEVLDQVRQVEQVLEQANAKKRLELERQTD